MAEFDFRLWQWVIAHQHPLVHEVLRWISVPTGSEWMFGWGCLATAWLLWKGYRQAAGELFLGNAIGLSLIWILKRILMRDRPPLDSPLLPESFALPSGHAMGTTITTLLLAWTLFRIYPSWQRPLLLASAVLIALVSVSRVYLGVYWASDVLAGILLGAVYALIWKTVTQTSRNA